MAIVDIDAVVAVAAVDQRVAVVDEEAIVAGAAAHPVGSGAAVEHVFARSAGEPVVAGKAVDHLAARDGIDHVGTGRAQRSGQKPGRVDRPIGELQALDGLQPADVAGCIVGDPEPARPADRGTAGDGIVALVAGKHRGIDAGTALHRVVAGVAGDQHVVAGAAERHVVVNGRAGGVEHVVAGAAEGGFHPGAGVRKAQPGRGGAGIGIDDVETVAALDAGVLGIDIHAVAPGPAVEAVGAEASGENVIAAAAIHDVVRGIADEHVGSFGAGDERGRGQRRGHPVEPNELDIANEVHLAGGAVLDCKQGGIALPRPDDVVRSGTGIDDGVGVGAAVEEIRGAAAEESVVRRRGPRTRRTGR